MSSLRKAVRTRDHKERSQPAARAKYGLLEKHKDYVLRARDFHFKEKRVNALKRKAAMRNPDEFYFGMISSKTVKGVAKGKRKYGQNDPSEPKELTAEFLKTLKTQDINYVTHQRLINKSKVEKLKDNLQLFDSSMPTSSGSDSRTGSISSASAGNQSPSKNSRRHVIFVDDKDEALSFDPAEHFDTQPELLGRTFNRPRRATIEESEAPARSGLKILNKAREQQYRELSARLDRDTGLRRVEMEMEVQKNLMTGIRVPSRRHGHRSFVRTSDGEHELIVLWGGSNQDDGILTDVWSFSKDSSTWQQKVITGTEKPLGLASFGLAVDPSNPHVAYVNAGITSERQVSNTLYEVDTESLIIRQLRPCTDPSKQQSTDLSNGSILEPPACISSSLVFLSSPRRLLAFGGLDELSNTLGQLHCYDFESNMWVKSTLDGEQMPIHREGHSADIWQDRNGTQTLVVFGGKTIRDDGVEEKLADLWLCHIDGYSLRWEEVVTPTAPPPRSLHGSCILGSKLIVHGGWEPGADGGSTPLSDMWIFNLETRVWAQAACQGAPRLANHSISAIQNDLYLFGGSTSPARQCNGLWKCVVTDMNPEAIEQPSATTPCLLPTISKLLCHINENSTEEAKAVIATWTIEDNFEGPFELQISVLSVSAEVTSDLSHPRKRARILEEDSTTESDCILSTETKECHFRVELPELFGYVKASERGQELAMLRKFFSRPNTSANTSMEKEFPETPTRSVEVNAPVASMEKSQHSLKRSFGVTFDTDSCKAPVLVGQFSLRVRPLRDNISGKWEQVVFTATETPATDQVESTASLAAGLASDDTVRIDQQGSSALFSVAHGVQNTKAIVGSDDVDPLTASSTDGPDVRLYTQPPDTRPLLESQTSVGTDDLVTYGSPEKQPQNHPYNLDAQKSMSCKGAGHKLQLSVPENAFKYGEDLFIEESEVDYSAREGAGPTMFYPCKFGWYFPVVTEGGEAKWAAHVHFTWWKPSWDRIYILEKDNTTMRRVVDSNLIFTRQKQTEDHILIPSRAEDDDLKWFEDISRAPIYYRTCTTEISLPPHEKPWLRFLGPSKQLHTFDYPEPCKARYLQRDEVEIDGFDEKVALFYPSSPRSSTRGSTMKKREDRPVPYSRRRHSARSSNS
ncbi:U3 small nucleolar RNA-associated protein 11 [Gonapodya sp. JEL0774]|nr:U3 small nucleolar RNA-associated protein 11 [Gonapodya sp. JEL0774]